MTTTVHKNLTGADLHEPKGAAAAASGQVYVSDGAGSGVWTTASSVIINTAFTTGDLKVTHKTSADSTWILWVDGTIGDGSSSATVRANADTSALFALYWNGYTNTLCPVSGGRGLSAAADFAAHKTITLPLGSSRSIGIAGSGSGLTARTLGVTNGLETVVLSTTNLPPYTPAGTNAAPSFTGSIVGANTGVSNNVYSTGGTPGQNSGFTVGQPAFTGTAQGGNSTPVSIIDPITYVNVMIKL